MTYTVNSGANTSVPEFRILVKNYLDFGMPDNIAYQPGSGNWVIDEDGDGATYTPPRNNDIWSCLDDGADKDNLADACVKVATLNDLTAEFTGGTFNADGTEYYVGSSQQFCPLTGIPKISALIAPIVPREPITDAGPAL